MIDKLILKMTQNTGARDDADGCDQNPTPDRHEHGYSASSCLAGLPRDGHAAGPGQSVFS